MLVGAPHLRGLAYAFDRSGEDIEVLKCTPRPTEGSDPSVCSFSFGWSVSLSADGSKMAIGAPSAFTSPSPGSAYAFVRKGTGFTSEVFTPGELNSQHSDDSYGYSVALSADGTRLLVGAPELRRAYGEGYQDYTLGAAFVYDVLNSSFHLLTVLYPATDGTQKPNFGRSVALSADGLRLLVGAPYDDENGKYAHQKAGAVYVYDHNGEDVALANVLRPIVPSGTSTSPQDAWFGRSLAISANGHRLMVGAPYYRGWNQRESGAVYAYGRNGSNVALAGVLHHFTSSTDHWFGRSVSLSADGSRFLVGAPYVDQQAGAVFSYIWEENDSFTLVNVFYPLNGTGQPDFGLSVDLSADGQVALVGAPFDNTIDAQAGAAYTFDNVFDVSPVPTAVIHSHRSFRMSKPFHVPGHLDITLEANITVKLVQDGGPAIVVLNSTTFMGYLTLDASELPLGLSQHFTVATYQCGRIEPRKFKVTGSRGCEGISSASADFIVGPTALTFFVRTPPSCGWSSKWVSYTLAAHALLLVAIPFLVTGAIPHQLLALMGRGWKWGKRGRTKAFPSSTVSLAPACDDWNGEEEIDVELLTFGPAIEMASEEHPLLLSHRSLSEGSSAAPSTSNQSTVHATAGVGVMPLPSQPPCPFSATPLVEGYPVDHHGELGLDDLPVDVLLHIFTFLVEGPQENLSFRMRLSLVCRRFYWPAITAASMLVQLHIPWEGEGASTAPLFGWLEKELLASVCAYRTSLGGRPILITTETLHSARRADELLQCMSQCSKYESVPGWWRPRRDVSDLNSFIQKALDERERYLQSSGLLQWELPPDMSIVSDGKRVDMCLYDDLNGRLSYEWIQRWSERAIQALSPPHAGVAWTISTRICKRPHPRALDANANIAKKRQMQVRNIVDLCDYIREHVDSLMEHHSDLALQHVIYTTCWMEFSLLCLAVIHPSSGMIPIRRMRMFDAQLAEVKKALLRALWVRQARNILETNVLSDDLSEETLPEEMKSEEIFLREDGPSPSPTTTTTFPIDKETEPRAHSIDGDERVLWICISGDLLWLLGIAMACTGLSLLSVAASVGMEGVRPVAVGIASVVLGWLLVACNAVLFGWGLWLHLCRVRQWWRTSRRKKRERMERNTKLLQRFEEQLSRLI